jgi:hypothetical protein
VFLYPLFPIVHVALVWYKIFSGSIHELPLPVALLSVVRRFADIIVYRLLRLSFRYSSYRYHDFTTIIPAIVRFLAFVEENGTVEGLVRLHSKHGGDRDNGFHHVSSFSRLLLRYHNHYRHPYRLPYECCSTSIPTSYQHRLPAAPLRTTSSAPLVVRKENWRIPITLLFSWHDMGGARYKVFKGGRDASSLIVVLASGPWVVVPTAQEA